MQVEPTVNCKFIEDCCCIFEEMMDVLFFIFFWDECLPKPVLVDLKIVDLLSVDWL